MSRTASPLARRASRLPFLGLAMATLVAALWGALVRVGWHVPLPSINWLSWHGPLMVCGFLGTVIGLERAVGLGRAWAYAAPLGTGLGGILLAAGDLSRRGPALVTFGSVVFLAVLLAVLKIQPERQNVVMALGGAAWIAGNARWLLGAPIDGCVLYWGAFIVLTIAGERLQLTRFLPPRRGSRGAFTAACVVLLAGLALAFRVPATGARVSGAAFLGLGVWLLLIDIARLNARLAGLNRFVGLALLPGYAWLVVSGAVLLVNGLPEHGIVYDAILHSLFVGFAFSMIFGHAPIVFPAVLSVTMTFRPLAYVPLALLHASLLARVAGDLTGFLPLRMWGGLGNVTAILMFLAVTISSIRRAPAAA
jgi:hypothetical protein